MTKHIETSTSNMGWTTDAIAERLQKAEKQRDNLLAALELLLERMDLPPDQNCSCHISPPCNDCADYGGIREAIKWAERELAEAKGTKS